MTSRDAPAPVPLRAVAVRAASISVGMTAQAKIIVGGEVEHARIRGVRGAQGAKEVGFFQGGKFSP